MKQRALFLVTLLAAPALWLGGLWVFDGVRVVAGLLLVGLLVSPRLRAVAVPGLGRERWVLGAWLALYFALLVAHMLARLHLGVQGIDFAIFSQVVDSIARTGAATCTLALTETPNFLWHHFTPVLYLPGALTWLGLPAPVAAVLVHAGGAAVGFGALFAVAHRSLGWTCAAAVVVTAVLSSAVRTELFWGLHDETFALAFVGLTLWAWLRGHFGLAALAAVLCGTCKESFFPFMAWFGVLALVFHRDFHEALTAPRARRAFGPLILLGLVGTVTYFFLQPLLHGRRFDHLDKLATLEVLLSPGVLAQKVVFMGTVLVGSCGLGLLTRKGRIVLATMLPLVGIVWISGYAEMWRPFGYYALVPSVLGFFAAVVSLETLKVQRPWLLSAPALVFAVCLAMSFTTNLPVRDVARALREDGLSASQLAWVPPGARVVADPGAALALLRTTGLRRLHHVGLMSELPPFDYVVLRPGGYEPLPENLEKATQPCHPSGSWVVRCPR